MIYKPAASFICLFKALRCFFRFPPIFWKEKEITIQQIQKWEPKKIKQLIYKLNELELNIKKNFNNSICLTTDFILEQSA